MTVSIRFGGTDRKERSTGGLAPCRARSAVGAGPTGAIAGPATAAAAMPDVPITSPAAPPALSRLRRVNAVLAMSPKYAFSDVLGTGWSHALPHRNWQVMALRPPCRSPSSGSSLRRDAGRGSMVSPHVREGDDLRTVTAASEHGQPLA